MKLYGGGWLKIDNLEANILLNVTQPNPMQGKCFVDNTQWKSWDQFDGAPGTQHECIGTPKLGNWMTYSEMRYDQFQLTGYTGGPGNTFDMSTDCYSVSNIGGFCVGPALQMWPPNTVLIKLGNGVKSPVYNRLITLTSPASDFEIRSREEGPQLEGIVWNTGVIYLR